MYMWLMCGVKKQVGHASLQSSSPAPTTPPTPTPPKCPRSPPQTAAPKKQLKDVRLVSRSSKLGTF